MESFCGSKSLTRPNTAAAISFALIQLEAFSRTRPARYSSSFRRVSEPRNASLSTIRSTCRRRLSSSAGSLDRSGWTWVDTVNPSQRSPQRARACERIAPNKFCPSCFEGLPPGNLADWQFFHTSVRAGTSSLGPHRPTLYSRYSRPSGEGLVQTHFTHLCSRPFAVRPKQQARSRQEYRTCFEAPLGALENSPGRKPCGTGPETVSYTHLRAHETVLDLVCRLLLEKTKKNKKR